MTRKTRFQILPNLDAPSGEPVDRRCGDVMTKSDRAKASQDTRISYQVSEEDHIIVLNYPPFEGEWPVWGQIREVLASLKDAWAYHIVLNREAMDTYTPFADVSQFASWWKETAAGRDTDRLTIKISRDPIIVERCQEGNYQALFPNRRLVHVTSMSEAMQLLSEDRKARLDVENAIGLVPLKA